MVFQVGSPHVSTQLPCIHILVGTKLPFRLRSSLIADRLGVERYADVQYFVNFRLTQALALSDPLGSLLQNGAEID
jgi:hypothetical protein